MTENRTQGLSIYPVKNPTDWQVRRKKGQMPDLSHARTVRKLLMCGVAVLEGQATLGLKCRFEIPDLWSSDLHLQPLGLWTNEAIVLACDRSGMWPFTRWTCQSVGGLKRLLRRMGVGGDSVYVVLHGGSEEGADSDLSQEGPDRGGKGQSSTRLTIETMCALWKRTFYWLASLYLLEVQSRDVPHVNVPGQGIVEGKEVAVTRSQRASVYLGIPFAAPPLKLLRFAPPVTRPLPTWNTPRNATEFAPACIQNEDDLKKHDRLFKQLLPEQAIKFSEDCLYLNVFVPDGTPPSEGWPVMVWLHPGDFNTGSTAWWDGSVLAIKQKVIVVTTAYRLNIFGFLTLMDGCPGNLGLLDQVAALDWVSTKIAVFGGSSENVCVFGHGAGGSSVGLHVLSPLSAGKFHKALAMSGSALKPGIIKDPEIQEMFANKLGSRGQKNRIISKWKRRKRRENGAKQVLTKELTLREASSRYNIPKSTLHDKTSTLNCGEESTATTCDLVSKESTGSPQDSTHETRISSPKNPRGLKILPTKQDSAMPSHRLALIQILFKLFINCLHYQMLQKKQQKKRLAAGKRKCERNNEKNAKEKKKTMKTNIKVAIEEQEEQSKGAKAKGKIVKKGKQAKGVKAKNKDEGKAKNKQPLIESSHTEKTTCILFNNHNDIEL
uniref:Carboxylesterase n=1 Tax=Timema douglasi TaxID=61478 RepID=A0A7R8VJL1_TIMDO|nr:unnamed protein product [Timema douglasi]